MCVAIFVISSSCQLRLCHQFLYDGGMKERQLFLLLPLLLLLFSPSLLLCGPQERLLCGEVGLSALLTSIQGRGGDEGVRGGGGVTGSR